MMSTTRKHILHINVFITSLIGIILGYMLFTQYFGPHSHSINAINTQRPAEKPFFKTWRHGWMMYVCTYIKTFFINVWISICGWTRNIIIYHFNYRSRKLHLVGWMMKMYSILVWIINHSTIKCNRKSISSNRKIIGLHINEVETYVWTPEHLNGWLNGP